MHLLRTCPALSGPISTSSRPLAIVALVMWLGWTTIATTTAQSESLFEPTWYMVVDRASLLDEGQESSAINDTWRLNLLGIPSQVVTELVESTPALAQQRADALRIEHGIESAPGAGDGILIYAAVNPANRSLVTVAISTGPNALPNGGLTQDNLAEIESTIVLPQLASGHPARAIVYAVREMIYQQVFTPPPLVAPSGARASMKEVLPWVAPMVAIPLAILALRNVRDLRDIYAGIQRAALPLGGGLLLALVAISVQSASAFFWAIGLGLVSVTVLILADRAPQDGDLRVLTTTPRPPGRFASKTEVGS